MTYGLGFHTLGCLPTDDLCCHIVPPQSTALSDGSVNISVVRARCEILCECGRSNPMIMVIVFLRYYTSYGLMSVMLHYLFGCGMILVIVLLVYYFTMPVMPNMDVYVMLHDFLLHFIS
jgi:hypothetical protein